MWDWLLGYLTRTLKYDGLLSFDLCRLYSLPSAEYRVCVVGCNHPKKLITREKQVASTPTYAFLLSNSFSQSPSADKCVHILPFGLITSYLRGSPTTTPNEEYERRFKWQHSHRYLGSRLPWARAWTACRQVGRLQPITDGGRFRGSLVMPLVRYWQVPPCEVGVSWSIVCIRQVSFSSSQCMRLIIFVTSSFGINLCQFDDRGGNQGQHNNLHMTKLHIAQHGYLWLHRHSVLKHVYRRSLSTLYSRINLDYMHEGQALSIGKLSLVGILLLPIFRQSFFHLPILNLKHRQKRISPSVYPWRS